MKKLLLILLCIPIFLFSNNEEQTTTIIVSGMGETIDEAKNNALRSAIEQSFGAFISSKTEILNDDIKDEIVSITNGSIHNYKIISQVEMPEGGYATTLEATVSVTQLVSFVKSKGIKVEFKGGLFTANIKQQKLNEEAERIAILNLCIVSDLFLKEALNHSVVVEEPKYIKGDSRYYQLREVEFARNFNREQSGRTTLIDGIKYKPFIKVLPTNYIPCRSCVSYNTLDGGLPFEEKYIKEESDLLYIPISIKLETNENYNVFLDNFVETIKAIGMSGAEGDNYKKLNKPVYYLELFDSRDKPYGMRISTKIYLRNSLSGVAIQNFFTRSNKYLLNFKLETDIKTIDVQYKNIRLTPESMGLVYDVWGLNSYDQFTCKPSGSAGGAGFPDASIWPSSTYECFMRGGDRIGYFHRASQIAELFLDSKRVFFHNYLAKFSEKDIEKITFISVNSKIIDKKKNHTDIYGIIVDPDGYTNMREASNTKSKVICKIYEGNKFLILDKSQNWWKIKYNGDIGYMHKNRIKIID